jgi:hypothetical protein
MKLVPCLLNNDTHVADVGLREIDTVYGDVVGSEAEALRDAEPFDPLVFVDVAALGGARQEHLGFNGQIARLLVGQEAWMARHQHHDEHRLPPAFGVACCQNALAFQSQHFQVARQSLLLDGTGQGFRLQVLHAFEQGMLIHHEPQDGAGKKQCESCCDSEKQLAGTGFVGDLGSVIRSVAHERAQSARNGM